MSTCQSENSESQTPIAARSNETFPLNVTECENSDEPNSVVNYIEQVQVFVTLTTDKRGDMEIYLYSPSATKTKILPVGISEGEAVDRNMSTISFRREPMIRVVRAFRIGRLPPYSCGRKSTWSVEASSGEHRRWIRYCTDDAHEHRSIFRLSSATLMSWRLAVHGTRDNPISSRNPPMPIRLT